MPLYDIDRLDNRDPKKIDRFATFVERTLARYHRSEVRHIERVPSGGALYVGNHNAGVYTPDTFIFGAAVYRAHGVDAVPFGLGHEVILQLPLFNQLLAPLGAVRASHENGERVLRAGKKALVYPGSDYDAMRPYRLRDRVIFDERRGYMRLALKTGVPIVPIVAAGAHSAIVVIDDLRWLAKLIGADRYLRLKVWPLVLTFPWGLTLGPPPPFIPFPSRIVIEVLEPMTFDRVGEQAAADAAYVDACSERVRLAMQAVLTRLTAERK